ncbi:MAG: M15 family metallopeptidase [Saprospiraceae bacterium]
MHLPRQLLFSILPMLLLACGSPSVSQTESADIQSAAKGMVDDAAKAMNDVGPTIPDWLPQDAAARKRELTGRIDPETHPDFVKLVDRYTDGDGVYLLRRRTANAVEQMIDSAKRDGVKLRVRSSTRNFDRQAQIWGAKWRGERTLSNGVNLGKTNMSDSAKARMILLYSSMPGTSRHHWGTDIDFNAFENDYFKTGKGLAEYEWLKSHAAHFGFYQPYISKENGRTGYEEERWHWSYRPLSLKLTELYKAEVTYADISGFDGAEVAPSVGAIEEYVLGLNEGLIPD